MKWTQTISNKQKFLKEKIWNKIKQKLKQNKTKIEAKNEITILK